MRSRPSRATSCSRRPCRTSSASCAASSTSTSARRCACSCAATRSGRFYSCLVYVPRDRYNTQARKRIESSRARGLRRRRDRVAGQLSESVLARLHMLVRTPADANHRVDAVELERRITETVRTWQDRLRGLPGRRIRRGRGAPARRASGATPSRRRTRRTRRSTPRSRTSRSLERLAAAPDAPAHAPVPARRPARPQGAVQAVRAACVRSRSPTCCR